jgi:hypothetical protein
MMKTIIRDIRSWTAVLAVALAGTAGAQVLEIEAPPVVEEAPVEVETASTPGADHKMTICHVAGKSGKTVTIEIDVAAWPAHQAHGDSAGGCREGCLTNADCAADEYCMTDIPTGAGGPRSFFVGMCGEVGTCEPLPGPFCPSFFEPACGCDGETYSNDCVAHAAGVNIEFYGDCGAGS